MDEKCLYNLYFNNSFDLSGEIFTWSPEYLNKPP